MLKIKTTGLEQFAPGGSARLRAVIIGPGDSGKTRFASYAPRPFFANCEAGLSSVADRAVPYADVNSSQDMLDVLEYMALECRRGWEQRRFHTIVVDTVDAFQRKVKDEWVRANPSAQTFTGYPAWGYLESKMQMLLTRLLNLDMNVLVLAHHKEKTIKEGSGESATERQELGIRLQGEAKDNIFDDYDLVGWMGTYYEAVDGQRTQKRGLTFKKTPERPFLKDRLDMTPPWIEVTFSEDDYKKLFTRLEERLALLGETREIGEIPRAVNTFGPTEGEITGIVAPGKGGALPPMEAGEAPLASRSKPELMTIAREMGIDGVKGNTLKSELVTMIEAGGGIEAWHKLKADGQSQLQSSQAAEAANDGDTDGPKDSADAGEGGPFTEEQLAEAAAIPQCMVAEGNELCVYDRNHAGDHSWKRTPEETLAANAEFAEAAQKQALAEQQGEVVELRPEETEAAAVQAVKEGLGGTVIERVPNKPAAPVNGTTHAPPKGVERPETCSQCSGDINADPPQELTGGKAISPTAKESYIRVAWIKHRAHMCAGCYLAKARPSA